MNNDAYPFTRLEKINLSANVHSELLMKKVVILSEKAQFRQKKIQGLTLRSSSKFCRSDTLHLHNGPIWQPASSLLLTNGKHPHWQRMKIKGRNKNDTINKAVIQQWTKTSKGRDKAAEKINDFFREHLEVEKSRGSQQLLFSIY